MFALCVFTVLLVGGGLLCILYYFLELFLSMFHWISEGIRQKSVGLIILGIVCGLGAAGAIYALVDIFS